jgi:hypothetical protein
LTWLTRNNFETGIELWHRLKGRAISRNAGYLILAAVGLESNIVQLLVEGAFSYAHIKVDIPDTPHWVTAVFVVSAVVLLIADRLLPIAHLRPEPNPHDIVLIKRVRELFDENMQIFLKDEDFGSFTIEYEPISRLHNSNYVWRGPEYEFIEPKVQEKWLALQTIMKEFGNEVATHTSPAEMGRDRVTVYSRNEYPEDRSDRTVERIRKLNDLATTVIERYYEMDALARRNIPAP